MSSFAYCSNCSDNGGGMDYPTAKEVLDPYDGWTCHSCGLEKDPADYDVTSDQFILDALERIEELETIVEGLKNGN